MFGRVLAGGGDEFMSALSFLNARHELGGRSVGGFYWENGSIDFRTIAERDDLL